MNGKDLLNSMEFIDEELICNADKIPPKPMRPAPPPGG